MKERGRRVGEVTPHQYCLVAPATHHPHSVIRHWPDTDSAHSNGTFARQVHSTK